MALFRPTDIRRETLDLDDGPYETEAPIAKREIALRQLRDATPFLNRVFAAEGTFDEHAALLERALRDGSGDFVTIELEEIAALSETFEDDFRACLATMNGDVSDTAKRNLLEMAGIKTLPHIPPARLFLDGNSVVDPIDQVNLCRILGTSHIRPVPWEEDPDALRRQPVQAPHKSYSPIKASKRVISDLQIAITVIVIALGGIVGSGLTSSPIPLYVAIAVGFVAVKLIGAINQARRRR